MDPEDLAERIHEDVLAWHEAGCPTDPDPRIAAYQHALGTVCALREAMDDGKAPLSIWGLWAVREDEALGGARLISRLRAAVRMALAEGMTPRVVEVLQSAGA
jgi:hypothetical protein